MDRPTRKRIIARGAQALVARKAGVSRHYLNDVLQGRRRPRPDRALLLERLLRSVGIRVTAGDMVFGTVNRSLYSSTRK